MTGRDDLALTFGWLPDDALSLYVDAYIDSGDSDMAMATLRRDQRYESWFPGNITEDGRPRYAEQVYAGIVASYDDVLRSVNLNPDVLRHTYGDLIRGEVSPDELETRRVQPMFERVAEASESIRRWYSEENGIEMTFEAILAGALDPTVGTEILNRNISMAEIGGEALEAGFVTDLGLVEQLYQAGIERDSADKLFGQAADFVPVLNVLANRHEDPDDDFDLNEFTAGEVFSDPFQRQRMRRLIAQERALQTGSSRLGIRRARSGGVAGLEEL